jgi:adenine-specific DNA-methyltransferase
VAHPAKKLLGDPTFIDLILKACKVCVYLNKRNSPNNTTFADLIPKACKTLFVASLCRALLSAHACCFFVSGANHTSPFIRCCPTSAATERPRTWCSRSRAGTPESRYSQSQCLHVCFQHHVRKLFDNFHVFQAVVQLHPDSVEVMEEVKVMAAGITYDVGDYDAAYIPLAAPHSTSQQHIAPHSTSQHLTAPHSTSQHLTAPHSTSQHLIAPHSTVTASHSTVTASHSTVTAFSPTIDLQELHF